MRPNCNDNVEKRFESDRFVMQAQTPVEDIAPGIKRQFLSYQDQIMAVRLWFEAGAVGAVHDHPHSQLCYVETGTFEVTIGEDVSVLGPGDSCMMPPHVPHGNKCIQAGSILDMFSPVREDFLSESGPS